MLSDHKHWETVDSEKDPTDFSWYQPSAERSLRLIAEAKVPKDAAILDVGGGASTLAGELVEAGYSAVTVADISASALATARNSFRNPEAVRWVEANLREHDFGREFDPWHDRAVFHFMVSPSSREGYIATLVRSFRPGGES